MTLIAFPLYQLQCDRCRQVWSSAPYRTLYLYANDTQMHAVARRALGWCYGCRRPTTMEGHRSHADIRVELSEIVAELQALQPKGFGGLVARIRNLFDASRQEALLLLNGRRAMLSGLERVLRKRQSAPRCLECGSASIIYLGDWARLEGGPIQFEHPSCGGRLCLQDMGDDDSGEEWVVLVDPEGVRLPGLIARPLPQHLP